MREEAFILGLICGALTVAAILGLIIAVLFTVINDLRTTNKKNES